MKTVMDYVEYNPQICGYLRKSVLSDQDYDVLEKELKTRKFENHEYPEETQYLWLQYLVDILLFEYYSKKITRGIQYKQKAFSLYFRIIRRYPDFYQEQDIDPFMFNEDVWSPSGLMKHLKSIIKVGYPHQVLTFCYKELIDGWGNQRIVSELSDNMLEKIFNNFINEYSEQSQLPCFFVSLCFIDLRDKLNQRLKKIILKNDGITPKKMAYYLDWITGTTILRLYYRENKEHDVTDWCNRIKEKTIIDLSKLLGSILVK